MNNEVKIINLTPHPIIIIKENGEKIILEKCNNPARCDSFRVKVCEINGISVNKVCFGQIYNLPEKRENTIYIVSRIIAEAAKDRDDLYIVDETIRDENGNIIGCKSLAKI